MFYFLFYVDKLSNDSPKYSINKYTKKTRIIGQYQKTNCNKTSYKK